MRWMWIILSSMFLATFQGADARRPDGEPFTPQIADVFFHLEKANGVCTASGSPANGEGYDIEVWVSYDGWHLWKTIPARAGSSQRIEVPRRNGVYRLKVRIVREFSITNRTSIDSPPIVHSYVGCFSQEIPIRAIQQDDPIGTPRDRVKRY